jgi:fibronectin-binding autotransporter adhesin
LGIVWDGAPVILTNNTNDYQGDTVVGGNFNGASGDWARLRMGVANALPYGPGKGNLVFAPTGNNILELNGNNLRVNGLSGGSPSSAIEGWGEMTLTVGDNDQTSTYYGNIRGWMRMTKVGSGTLTLAGATQLERETRVDGGTLALADVNALQNSILDTNGAGAVTFVVPGANDYTISALSGSGTLAIGANTITLKGRWVDFNGTIGNPGDTGAVVKISGDEMRLLGTSNYTGGTTLLQGITQLETDRGLGADNVPTVLTLNGGTLQNHDSTVDLSANRTVYLADTSGNGGFRAGWGKSITVNGKITGPGSLNIVWDGAPVILKNPANDYTGDTIIGGAFGNGGSGDWARIQLGANNVLPYGPGKGNLVFAPTGNNYLNLGGYSAHINGLIGYAGVGGANGSVIEGNGTIYVGETDRSDNFPGSFRGDVNLTKVGAGTLTLSGVNEHWQTTRIDGGTLALANQKALQRSIFDTDSPGTLSYALPGNNEWYFGDFKGSRNFAIGDKTIYVWGRWQDFRGIIGAPGDTGRLVKWSGDEFRLLGNNNYTGGTTILAGRIMLESDLSLGPVPTDPNVPNLILNGGTLQNYNTSPVLNAKRTISLGAAGGGIRAGWGDRNGGQSITVNGKITGPGNLTIVWDGAAVVLTNPANDYVGNTVVGGSFNGESGNTAYLKLGVTNALPFGPGKGNLVFAGSGNNYFNLNGFSTQINGLSGGGNTTNYIDNRTGGGSPVLTVGNNDQNASFSGVISNSTGTLNLTKVGTGTLTLNGANTYSGKTLVNGGTLAVNNVRALAGSTLDTNGLGAVTWTVAGSNSYYLGGLEGAKALNLGTNTFRVGANNTNTTFSGAISSTGTSGGVLVKEGSGSLRLAGVNTYKGGTILSGTGTISGLGSTLVIAEGSSLGTPRMFVSPLLFDGAAPPTMTPGYMVAGRLAGSWNTTDPNPANRTVYNGLMEQTVNTNSGNSAVIDYPAPGGRLWVDNSTWVYASTLTITTPGTYSFAQNFDDNAKLIIDGTTVFQNGSQDQGQITLAAGTHSFEMRFGQGGGGVGPYNWAGNFQTRGISLGYYQGATTNWDNYTQIPTEMLGMVVSNWRSVVFEHSADGHETAGWTTELNAYWPFIMVDGAVLGGAVNDAVGSTPIVNKINDTFTVTDMTVGLRADRITGAGSTVGTVNFSNVTLTAETPGVTPGSTLYLLGDANVLVSDLVVAATSTVTNNAAGGRIRNTTGAGDLILAGNILGGNKAIQFGGTLANNKIIIDTGASAIMDDPGTSVGGMGAGGIEIKANSTLTVSTPVTGNTTYHIMTATSQLRVKDPWISRADRRRPSRLASSAAASSTPASLPTTTGPR